MSEPRDDLRDDLLSTRLGRMIGEPPAHLTARLESLAGVAVGARRELRRPSFWIEAAPQLAGIALLLALLAGFVPPLVAWLRHPSAGADGATAAWMSLLVPIGMGFAVEALRGAPILRRWWR